MSKFKIRHLTKYTYDVPVRDSANQIMLYPVNDAYQELVAQEIIITGDPVIDRYQDYYGNEVGTFMHSSPHNLLTIDSRLQIIVHPIELPADTQPTADQWKSLADIKYQSPFIDFLRIERFEGSAALEERIKKDRKQNFTPLQLAQHLCQYVYETFKYKKGITTVETTLDEIWQLKSGVCQDFAHMLLVIMRMADIPARYVSGYVCPNKSGMRGEGATHAWIEVYLPAFGWLGVDPTNNCIPNGTHVKLAVGRSFSDCSPVKGTYRGTSDHTLEVIVTVADEASMAVSETLEIEKPEPPTVAKNSFRRFQEMQQQQQQQQQQM